MCLLAALITSPEPIRTPAYEIFLRFHQLLATAIAYTMWHHVVKGSTFPSVCVYIMVGIMAANTVLELIMIVWRNFAFKRPYPSACISVIKGSLRISLTTARPWKIRAGQYLNLWIPSVSFWSTHPFTIVSWTKSNDPILELLVEPREGFTNRLLQKASKSKQPLHLPAFYSGPHGITHPFGNCGSVLMVASGYGVAALLPYIQELIRGYNGCEVRTRRLHLVWLLQEPGGHPPVLQASSTLTIF